MTFPDHLAADLRHWAAFGLVYPRSPTFEPGSPTPGHEAAPPRYKPGADAARIEMVEETLLAARLRAFAESTAAATAARKEARRLALLAALPVSETTGDAEALDAARPAHVVGCRMRAILALVYGPTRGHAALERVLATAECERLKADAERYYEAASAVTEHRHFRRSRLPRQPLEVQCADVRADLRHTISELRRLVRELGLSVEGIG